MGMAIEDWIRWQKSMSADAYIRQMRSPETWGGAMEIAMMTRIYVVDISVFSTDITPKRLASFVWDDTRTARVSRAGVEALTRLVLLALQDLVKFK